MVSVFQRVRVIGNNAYRYEEYRWRENGRMKSKSICLGRVDEDLPRFADIRKEKKKKPTGGLLGFIEAQRAPPGTKAMEEWEERANAAAKAERAAKEREARERADRELTAKAVAAQEAREAKKEAPAVTQEPSQGGNATPTADVGGQPSGGDTDAET